MRSFGRRRAPWFIALVAVLPSAGCGAPAGDDRVALPCTPGATPAGSCPDGFACVTSTFFGMRQSFCYPASRPRCGGTTCCPGGMRCYQRGFGPIDEGALFCLAPQEAARLCTHPQNHFVCSTRFGMLEPVPYATPTCPDPFDDGGPPARPEAGLDATVSPGMDASRPDVTRPEPDASRPDVSRPDASRPDATAMDALSVDASRPDASRPDGSASDGAGDAGRPDVEPSGDAAVCAVSEGSPDCDTLAPCSAATFMASCDDGERLRYCEAAAGSPTATVRIRFCVGADVCRACRGGECAPGFESVCAPR